LPGAARYFLGCHCYRLSYASQREDRYDRGLRQANKPAAREQADRARVSSSTNSQRADIPMGLLDQVLGEVLAPQQGAGLRHPALVVC
jgi:hypothetical protein